MRLRQQSAEDFPIGPVVAVPGGEPVRPARPAQEIGIRAAHNLHKKTQGAGRRGLAGLPAPQPVDRAVAAMLRVQRAQQPFPGIQRAQEDAHERLDVLIHLARENALEAAGDLREPVGR